MMTHWILHFVQNDRDRCLGDLAPVIPTTRGGRTHNSFFFGVNTTAITVFSDPEFFADDLRRTKAGESRLDQVRADESGEPEPIRADPVRQGQAPEHDGAGQDTNSIFDCHKFKLIKD